MRTAGLRQRRPRCCACGQPGSAGPRSISGSASRSRSARCASQGTDGAWRNGRSTIRAAAERLPEQWTARPHSPTHRVGRSRPRHRPVRGAAPFTSACHGRSGTMRPEAAVRSLPNSRLSAAFNAPAIGDIAVPDASTDEAVWCSDVRAWRVALLREVSRPTASFPLRRCATKAKQPRATVRL